MAVALTACGSKSPTAPTSPAPGGGTAHTISIILGAYTGGNGFSPSSITIPVGDTITWQNSDSVEHTATANDASFDSGSIAPGGSYSVKFTKSGNVPYKCTLHGFGATITVQ